MRENCNFPQKIIYKDRNKTQGSFYLPRTIWAACPALLRQDGPRLERSVRSSERGLANFIKECRLVPESNGEPLQGDKGVKRSALLWFRKVSLGLVWRMERVVK